MTILQMEYFTAVAECGSFSHAAEKYFISQQGISRQIAAAEAELGVSLIDRSNRKRIRLTKEGEAVLPVWKKITESYRASLEEAQILAGKLQKKLRIGIYEAGPIVDYVMPLINGYRAYEGAAEIECVFGSEDSMMTGLETGELDIVFALCGKYRGYSISSYPVYYDRVCIAMSRKHPLAEREELSVRDIADLPVYVLNGSYSFDANENVRKLLLANHCTGENIVEVRDLNNLEMLLHMAKGVTFAPRLLLRNTSGDIRFFPVEAKVTGDAIVLYAIWKQEKTREDVMKIIGIREVSPESTADEANDPQIRT